MNTKNSILFLGVIVLVKGQGYHYSSPLTIPPLPPSFSYLSSPPIRPLPPLQSQYHAPTQHYLPPLPTPSYLPPISSSIFSQNQVNTGYDYSPPAVRFNSFSSTSEHSSYRSFDSTVSTHQEAPIITKHFYFHTAAEEPEENQHKVIKIGKPRKNYRVLFIRAPSQSSKSSISVVPSQHEEKTIIYVLTKQSDASDIKATVKDTRIPPSKPEVFFIKYKTSEEALQAQRQIQAQFETLGGTTQFTDHGVLPVSSVIGSTGASSKSKSAVSENVESKIETSRSSGYRYSPPP